MMSMRMGGGAGTGDWGLGSVTRRTDRAIGSPSPAFGRGVGVRARLLAGNIKSRTLTRRFAPPSRSEEHTSELQPLMRISYAVFCLKKKQHNTQPLSFRTSPY